MKLKLLLFMLLLTVFPTSLFSNTLFFPQVAFGGGYSTTFVILNTGTTPISSTLNFYGQDGVTRPDLAVPINLAAGNSIRVVLPNNGPLTIVWAELIAGAGTVKGVATFDNRAGGVLVSSAGVLGVEGNGGFLIPVEVTPSSATGVAVSNVSVLGFNVRLRLFREDGTLVGSASDSRFSPLPTHGQVADFVTSFFPQLANTTFRGTLLLDAPAGAPPNALAATALAVKEGLLSALPVVAGGSPGNTTLIFPQVAFGDGYSTTITIINAGLVAVTSQLRFFSQNGALRSDLSTTVNLAVGGSARYTIPNMGPLTVVWGELVTTAGTVEGVATFELRAANGTLTTAAGVLGIQPGNAFSLPVDVAPNGQTGIAIANVKDTNVNVGYRLIGETASQIAIASDLRFLSLPSRGQVAGFIDAVFPIIAGTNFRGALIIEAGPAAAPGSLAATALTVKEGLLAALPVIPGTLVSNTGGGGGTGGGGTGGGGTGGGGTTGNNGPASACINPSLYNSVFTTHLEYNIVSGSFTGTSVSDTTSKLNVAFEGVTATEFSSTNSITLPNVGTTTVSGKSYGSIDGLDVIGYGGTSDITMPIAGTTKVVFTPPSRDKRYSLAAGASATQTYTINSTATFTGLPPIVSSQSQTETVRYLGRDSVTVPAGTFDTCKFEQTIGTGASAVTSTQWTAAGSASGVLVKSVSPGDAGSTTTLELKAGTINGSAIH